MDQQQYLRLVRRLEVEARASPAVFRAKVLCIGVSAHLALAVVVLALVALLWLAWSDTRSPPGFAVVLRLVVCSALVLPAGLVVLRLFFTRLHPPEGRALTRREAPKLFASLDKLRQRMRGPRFHKVLLDDSFTAAVAQVPRFGLFGRPTNYLVLGLPYMMGLPPREMLAAVAHEYSQMCAQQDKLGAWMQRQRVLLGALHAQLDDDRDGKPLNAAMAALLQRFVPRYNAYTFALARQRAYQADRTVAEVLSPAICAHGLVRDALLGRWVHDEFWPKLYRQADRAPQPRFMPFKSMGTAFKASHDEWAAPERLAAALAQKADPDDSQPSLHERLAATGQQAAVPAPLNTMAAEGLLGNTMTRKLVDEFDADWWQRERGPWEKRCHYATRSRLRLAELAVVAMEELALADLQQMALLTAEFESPQAAKPLFKHLLKQPGGPFPKAAFVLGRILLEEDNRRGLEHLEYAAAHDAALVPAVVEVGHGYLAAHDGDLAAETWSAKMLPGQDDD